MGVLCPELSQMGFKVKRSLFCHLQGKNVSKDSVAGDARMERVTAAILSGAPAFSAADSFDAFTQLSALRCAARVQMAKVDFLVVPSAAHHYTVAGAFLLPLSFVLRGALASSHSRNVTLG